jgi:hypothetical protein
MKMKKYWIPLLLLSGILYLSLERVNSPVRDHASLIPFLLSLQILLKDASIFYLGKIARPYSRFWKFLLAPGTILHELSHASAVILCGGKIKRIQLFNPDPSTGTLGWVEYSSPEDAWITLRDLIVAFAPFFGCGIFVFLILLLIQPSILVEPSLLSFLKNFQFESPLAWIAGYLILCSGFGAAPSPEDFKSSFRTAIKHPFGTFVVGCIIFLLIYFGEKLLFIYTALIFLLSLSIGLLLLSIFLLFLGSNLAKLQFPYRILILSLFLLFLLFLFSK